MQDLRGYKYKLTPTKEQRSRLRRQSMPLQRSLGSERIGRYRQYRITYGLQASELKLVKKDFPLMKDPPSQTLQQTLRDLDGAYQKFFKGEAKYP